MIPNYSFCNDIPREDLALGILVATNVDIHQKSKTLEERLANVLTQRKGPLTKEEDQVRLAARKLLRNGSYKPSGRSKPASEYLIRAATQENFPRINTAVDIINYLSLKYLVPISLWDTDLAKAKKYLFRLGKETESYIFNQADQTISLKDLVTGFVVDENEEKPIVNPVKDSLATKTTAETTNIATAIYAPFQASTGLLENMLQEFIELMKEITKEEIYQQIVAWEK